MRQLRIAISALLLVLGASACAMHSAQTATPPLGNAGSSPAIHPFDTHGGISSSSYQLGDAAPIVSGSQLLHLNLGIREIDVTDASGHLQVVASYSTPFVVDVLQYQDGSGATVGSGIASAFGYRQLSLVLDTNSSRAIFADGTVARLQFEKGNTSDAGAGATSDTDTDSAGRGQVTITDQRPFALRGGQTLNIDFNAFESLGNRDGNIVHVRPVLFTAIGSNAGRITGQVLNRDGGAVSNGTVVACDSHGGISGSAATDRTGTFDLHTLPAGTYTLVIYNNYTNAAGVSFKAQGSSSDRNGGNGLTVIVTPGTTTSVGTIRD